MMGGSAAIPQGVFMRTSFAGLAMLALLGVASGSDSNTNVPRAPKHYVLPATPEIGRAHV